MTGSDIHTKCLLCPRRCAARRDLLPGYCGETDELRLACASIHRGEEPPLTGTGGSGAIFVSGCNLGCVFCQNHQISGRQPAGKPALGGYVSKGEFVKICLALQEKGAENINIVTGSHAVPAIAAGLRAAKESGLVLPVLWNSSAYELPETLALLDGLVDVFLPDLKTLNSKTAETYFHAPGYPEIAAAAIQWMMRKPAPKAPDVPAVIVRHLVLPGSLASTRQVLLWFAEHGVPGKARLSLMFQYTPCRQSDKDPSPRRYIRPEEYGAALDWLAEFGIEDGYCQELVPGTTNRLPDFTKTNPFPPGLSVTVWHWRTGWVL